jgi:hypothetical protein
MGLEALPEALLHLGEFKAWNRASSVAKQLQWLPELLLGERERARESQSHRHGQKHRQNTAPTNPQTSSNRRGDQDNQTSDRPGDVARNRSSKFGDASPQKRAAGALARH